MKFVSLTQFAVDIQSIPDRADVAYVGEELDDRGRKSAALAKASATECCKVRYDPKTYELQIDDKAWRASDVDTAASRRLGKRILLDATTLDFPELLLLMRGYVRAQASVIFDILYIEPKGYRQPKRRDGDDLHAFELSVDNAIELHAIPGFTPVLGTQHIVSHVLAFLGFETKRFSYLLEDFQSQAVDHCTIIFGVPPYKTQWETHALMQNAPIITNNQVTAIKYAGANNPRSSYNLISEIYDIRQSHEVLEVAPLGTKPATIAAALFAATHSGVGVRFDFPKRAVDRTEGVSRIHLYTVRCQGI